MGKVHYKFTYNDKIERPEKIMFGGRLAKYADDDNGVYTIEGDVEYVALNAKNQLAVFVRSSGRAEQTWELEVTFDDKKLKNFPIYGTIEDNGFKVLKKSYDLQK